MARIFLTDLADVVRTGEPFIKATIEVPGWQTRARGSGGYNGRVKGVSHHHDAGKKSSDGWPAVNYETHIADAAPIANLHLDRKGQVWVAAAGATNTIGAGGPMGDFTLNDGNQWQIGIEGGNDGLGEPWPEVQVRAYVELSARLWIAYNARFGWRYPLDPNQFFDHRRWAPSRKIDRKGDAGCMVDGVWYQFAKGYSYWDTDLYYKCVSARIMTILFPPAPPKPEPPKPDPKPEPPAPEPIPRTTDWTFPGDIKMATPLDYGIRQGSPENLAGVPVDWWWTEMAITPAGLVWSGGPTEAGQVVRAYFVAMPNLPRAPRVTSDADMIARIRTFKTIGPPPSTFFDVTTGADRPLSLEWKANSRG